MRSILNPFKAPICALAFDPFRNFIALACGGDVFVYVQSHSRTVEHWERIDHMAAPCNGRNSLVMALFFFGASLPVRNLFVGHAKAGFS